MSSSILENFKWHCVTEVRKFHGDSTDEKDLYDTVVIEGNAVAAAGVSAMFQQMIGNGVTTAGNSLAFFNTTNSAIGVGDSTTANATPCVFTDLQATTNKTRVTVDAGYPAHTAGSTAASMTITFRSTFGTSTANYAWNEWGIFNSATAGAGSMLNRKQEALGTKAANSTWQLTVTLTIQ